MRDFRMELQAEDFVLPVLDRRILGIFRDGDAVEIARYLAWNFVAVRIPHLQRFGQVCETTAQ